jgi:hypothetical protein
MANIAALVTSVATLVVALGVLFLVMKVSKAVDAITDHFKKDK